ncbi:MAG TPA: DUF4384 domain-containing protein [Bryobacteraceae bacterium]
MRVAGILVPLVMVSMVASAADSDALAARRLYYQDNAPEVVFKATTVASKPAPPKPKPAVTAKATAPEPSKAQQIERIQDALRAAATTALASNGAAIKPVSNLGVRYNLLKVDAKSDTRTNVDPETVFHQGDCVAVRIQPNRGGFLYVFNQASSGNWQVLIPSAETSEDSNIVRAYNLMDVPQNYCFEMDANPGIERLLIVVTDKPEDVMKLNDSLKRGSNGNSNTVVAANDIKPFTPTMQGRDLKVTKVGNKPSAGEAPYSTYLVNAAATTSDRLVFEIKLKHEK